MSEFKNTLADAFPNSTINLNLLQTDVARTSLKNTIGYIEELAEREAYYSEKISKEKLMRLVQELKTIAKILS